MTNPSDAPAVAVSSFIAYALTWLGVADPVVQEGLLCAAGLFMGLGAVCYVAESGRKLGAMFISGTVGTVTAILILNFTPAEYRFYGMGGVAFFASVYWLSPLLNTLRRLFKKEDFVAGLANRGANYGRRRDDEQPGGRK